MRHDYRSPDGVLRLFFVDDGDDTTIGFEGMSWHTHGDVIAGELTMLGIGELAAATAARRLVDDLLSDRVCIRVVRIDGKIDDVSASYLMSEPDEYASPRESVELRAWSGKPWKVTGSE